MMSDYKVEMVNDGMQEFYVDFHGPSDSKSSTPRPFFFFFVDLDGDVYPCNWTFNVFMRFGFVGFFIFVLMLCYCFAS